MKLKTTNTRQILSVMQIITWIAYIGLCIKTGAILISFGVSFVNPEAAKNLYKGLNLDSLRQANVTYYVSLVSFMVIILMMKAHVFYLVTKILSKITLANPFKMEVAKILEQISYVLLGTWIVGMLSNAYTSWLLKRTGEVFESGSTDDFLFMAGLVFIISQVFKRGVEIQTENELTV
ncbi:DUF2975 domain-containing protein [Spirosoma sp. HMF3257]|uniref:DUF2975 domain-containing protein n=1 Tax=Spirosoma telluris TaxID=2183553 RepID=A0A327NMD0_9BACT|nr:DUF2975 domain-containing protein [Spirosoma telluris]RAI76500.1 DUF2975 domain-containing protein [Spirosoma telluris]